MIYLDEEKVYKKFKKYNWNEEKIKKMFDTINNLDTINKKIDYNSIMNYKINRNLINYEKSIEKNYEIKKFK